MLRIIPVIYFLMQMTVIASAEDRFSCADAIVDFSFVKSAKSMEGPVEAIISISQGVRSTTLRYDGNIDFIGGVCVPNEHSEPTIVFQAYCGGTGCNDLDNWGIVDPKDLRVELVPNDWNRKDAQNILGRPLPKITPMISLDEEAKKLGI